MFAIVITEKGGSQHREHFDQNEVTIGRVQGNDVILGKGNVSKRHSRIVRKDGRFIVVDLKSTNGTYVNGRKITAPLVVKPGDKIYIGDFILTLENDDAAPESAAPLSGSDPVSSSVPAAPAPAELRVPPPPAPPRRAVLEAAAPRSEPVTAPPAGGAPTVEPPARRFELVDESSRPAHEPSRPVSSGPPGAPTRAGQQSNVGREFELDAAAENALRALMARVAEGFDVRDASARSMDDRTRWADAERVIERAHRTLVSAGAIDPSIDAGTLCAAALRESVGLGPLETLLADEGVREIVIHGPYDVSIDRGEGLSPVATAWSDAARLGTVIERLFARAGELLDRAEPIHEAMLPNGAHVTVILPPVAVRGPIVEIRRLGKGPSLDELVARGFLGTSDRAAIERAVAARRNVFVVGPSGSGVTHLVGAITTLIPANERLVTVEAVPDLGIERPGTISLAAGRGRNGASFLEVLDKAHRLRGDRLVVDDVGAAELGRVLSVLASRQGGNVVGVRAMLRPEEDAIHGLSVVAKLGAGGVRGDAIEEWIARVVGTVVEIESTPAGRKVRRVVTAS